MPNLFRRLPLLAVTAALAVAGCSSAASPVPTGTTGGSAPPDATNSPQPDGIDHEAGATDVVLRYEEGGGMMILEMSATQVPIFTLYGDGTVIFRDPATQPMPNEDGLLVHAPFRIARLSEEQIQELLAFALNEGGLRVANARYENPMVADAGTAMFTIAAGGETKTVEVYGLGIDEGAPDVAMRARFNALAERLRTFDEGGSIATDEYTPQAWRAFLFEAGGVPSKVSPWPWPGLTPKDFPSPAGDPNVQQFPSRPMSAEEIAALGLGDLKGGLMGLYVEGPDGKTYSVPIRPILPDEER